MTNIDCTKVPSVVIVLSVKALLGTTTFWISHTKHLYIKYMPLNCCGEFRFLSMRLMQLFVFLVVTLSNIIAFLTTVEENARSKIATAETI